MPPPPPRPPKRELEVLEEEEYTSHIEAIIERDFYPDIPKMQNQLEWMEAVNSGDPALIRQAKLNISRRRAGLKTPGTGQHVSGTPSQASTPLLATPSMTPCEGLSESSSLGTVQLPGGSLKAPKVSLDKFFSKYTSEDNDSFHKIQEEEQERKDLRHKHHLEDKNPPLLLEGPQLIDGYGSTGQSPGSLVPSKYVARNSLYYPGHALPLSDKELAERVKGPPKAIAHSNTRLPSEVETTAPASTSSQPASAVRGFSYMPTPSPAPGVSESPFMTWGDIESTPIRLDMEDFPVDMKGSEGPQFRMFDVPVKERVGRSLATGHTPAGIHKKRKATPSITGLIRTSTPGMSPAARKLAQILVKTKTPSADKQLRASYSTPSRPSTSVKTPKVKPGSSTPLRSDILPSVVQVKPFAAKSTSSSITDDLLKL